MPGETARLFISIPIDDALRKSMRRIDWWVDHLDGFRKVPPGRRHVTVAFLGDVPLGAVEEICTALGSTVAAHRMFVMPVIGLAPMPSAHRQRALVVDLDATTGFAALSGSVRTALLATAAGATIAGEAAREPRPHITFGRKKRSGGSRPADFASAPPFGGAVPAEHVELIRSELTSQGPIYTPLWRHSLTGPADC